MLQIDQIAYATSLKNVHPIEKVVFAFSFLIFSLKAKSIWISLITFIVMSVIILVRAKVSWRYYVKMLMLPLFFLVTSVMTLLISVAPADYVLESSLYDFTLASWKLYISFENFNRGIQLIFLVMASTSCMYLLILTTPLRDIMWLLQKVKMPPLFVELLIFTYRFIFVLLDKAQEIHVAQTSRLGYVSYRIWIFSLGQLVVGIFLKAMHSAKELQIAMDSRGGQDNLQEVESNHSYNKHYWVFIGGCIILLSVLTGILA